VRACRNFGLKFQNRDKIRVLSRLEPIGALDSQLARKTSDEAGFLNFHEQKKLGASKSKLADFSSRLKYVLCHAGGRVNFNCNCIRYPDSDGQ